MGLFGGKTDRKLKEVSELARDHSYAELARMLSDRDTDVRCAAADALGACGPEAMPATIYPTLNRKDAETQEAAGRALREMGEEAVWEVFRAHLSGELENLPLTAVVAMEAAAEKPLTAIALGQGDWEGSAKNRMASDPSLRGATIDHLPIVVTALRDRARLSALAALKIMVLQERPLTARTIRVLKVIVATSEVAQQHVADNGGKEVFVVPARDANHYTLMLAERDEAMAQLLEGKVEPDEPVVPLPPIYPDDVTLGVLAADIVERAN